MIKGDDKGPTIHSENVDQTHAPQRPSMGGCPVMHQAHTTTASAATDWWPNSLNLDILHQQDKRLTQWEQTLIMLKLLNDLI
ncbi:hypothetical protein PKHYL_23050 [Psychrobacter sp. KH172YL61]|nr:hypothetical protein PKHYL_23050 [Psychrobacter sp. KH172YL61]